MTLNTHLQLYSLSFQEKRENCHVFNFSSLFEVLKSQNIYASGGKCNISHDNESLHKYKLHISL